MGGGATELGILAAVYGLSYTIFAPISGRLADKYGKHKIILIGLFGFTISNILFIVARDFQLLLIARFIEGAFSVAVFPAAIALVSDISNKSNRAKYIGYLVAGNSLGFIIGPVLGGFLYKIDLYFPFYVSTILAAITFIFAFYKIPKGNMVEVDIESVNNKLSLKETIMILPKPIKVFLIFALVDILAVLTWLVVEPGISFYIYDVLFMEPSDFGLFISSYGLFIFISQVFLGSLSDKIDNRKYIISLGLALNTVFFVLLLFATSTIGLILSAAIAGIGLGLLSPAMKAMLTEASIENYKTTILGIEASFVGLSLVVGPLIGGYLYDITDMFTLLYIAIFLGLLSVILSVFLEFDKDQSEPNEKVKRKEILPIAI
jgi:DHA1 family multidrug resistance protein-like MFS transporter